MSALYILPRLCEILEAPRDVQDYSERRHRVMEVLRNHWQLDGLRAYKISLITVSADGLAALDTVYPSKYAHGFCCVVVIHWLIFPYPSGLLHWHCGNLTIAPVPAKQPWWIWINTSCEFIMNDCVTTTKQSTTKPCAYFLGYTVLVHLQQRDERISCL